MVKKDIKEFYEDTEQAEDSEQEEAQEQELVVKKRGERRGYNTKNDLVIEKLEEQTKTLQELQLIIKALVDLLSEKEDKEAQKVETEADSGVSVSERVLEEVEKVVSELAREFRIEIENLKGEQAKLTDKIKTLANAVLGLARQEDDEDEEGN